MAPTVKKPELSRTAAVVGGGVDVPLAPQKNRVAASQVTLTMVERPRPTYAELRKRALETLDCRWCGICCELCEGALRATAADVARWVQEGRHDVLRYVQIDLDAAGAVRTFSSEIWLDPGDQSRSPVVRCPFLTCTWEDGFRCAIWPTRPQVCAEFACGGERCQEARLRLARR